MNSKEIPRLTSFKHTLNQTNISVPKYFFVGDRRPQVLQTRLRTKCSVINYEIYLKNLIDTPLCRFGNIQISEHFFTMWILPQTKTRNDTNYFSTLPHHLMYFCLGTVQFLWIQTHLFSLLCRNLLLNGSSECHNEIHTIHWTWNDYIVYRLGVSLVNGHKTFIRFLHSTGFHKP